MWCVLGKSVFQTSIDHLIKAYYLRRVDRVGLRAEHTRAQGPGDVHLISGNERGDP